MWPRLKRPVHEGKRGAAMEGNEKLVVLFDGSCGFCTAMAELLRVLNWRHCLHCLPFQAPGVPQAHGLTVAQCEQVLWAISPDGRSCQGAQAVNAALDALIGLPLFQFLFRCPGIGQIEDKLYLWVASHRHFFQVFVPIANGLNLLVASDAFGAC
jgi:predicted DCC family thiol-disulfide oxidoreductase YuxK